jgi:hypothetical protein
VAGIISPFEVGDRNDNAKTKLKEALRKTSVCARARTCPRPQSFVASFVRSTPVRWLYCLSRTDCLSGGVDIRPRDRSVKISN